MDREKRTVPYKYKDEHREERVGFIDPKKAKRDKKFKEQAIKRAKRKGKPLPEEENKEN